MKEYTIKHETTGEERKINAISIDSSYHKYQWTFFGVESTGENSYILSKMEYYRS